MDSSEKHVERNKLGLSFDFAFAIAMIERPDAFEQKIRQELCLSKIS